MICILRDRDIHLVFVQLGQYSQIEDLEVGRSIHLDNPIVVVDADQYTGLVSVVTVNDLHLNRNREVAELQTW